MSTVAELKNKCRSKGISGYSNLRKAELERLCKGKPTSIGKGKPTSNGKSGTTSHKLAKTVGSCTLQHTSKYANRPSPPFPAQSCRDMLKMGNDGNWWKSRAMSNGVFTWKLK